MSQADDLDLGAAGDLLDPEPAGGFARKAVGRDRFSGAQAPEKARGSGEAAATPRPATAGERDEDRTARRTPDPLTRVPAGKREQAAAPARRRDAPALMLESREEGALLEEAVGDTPPASSPDWREDDVDRAFRQSRQQIVALRRDVRRLAGLLGALEQSLAGSGRLPDRPVVERVHVDPPVVAAGSVARVQLTVRLPRTGRVETRWRAPAGILLQAGDGACAWSSPPTPGLYPLGIAFTMPDGTRHEETVEVEVYQPARIWYADGVLDRRLRVLDATLESLRGEARSLVRRLRELSGRAGELPGEALEWIAPGIPTLTVDRKDPGFEARLAGCTRPDPGWRARGGRVVGSLPHPERPTGLVTPHDPSAWSIVTAEWVEPGGTRWLVSAPLMPVSPSE